MITITNRNICLRDFQIFSIRALFLSTLVSLAMGSLMPSGFLPNLPFQDKLLHFAGYAVVASLAMLSIRSERRQLIGMLILVALGIALELGQTFVPGRALELGDMAANSGGILLAAQLHRFHF